MLVQPTCSSFLHLCTSCRLLLIPAQIQPGNCTKGWAQFAGSGSSVPARLCPALLVLPEPFLALLPMHRAALLPLGLAVTPLCKSLVTLPSHTATRPCHESRARFRGEEPARCNDLFGYF